MNAVCDHVPMQVLFSDRPILCVTDTTHYILDYTNPLGLEFVGTYLAGPVILLERLTGRAYTFHADNPF